MRFWSLGAFVWVFTPPTRLDALRTLLKPQETPCIER